ncbi:two-component system response regulator [Moorena producens PAL-8-15-08-1]|uniref:Two-component system response regulator n=1 Tax=Moorena producens PAL-8-15-08-1 TaxID=1458985 RepID=A0A1D8U1X2_9CYAN|nr:response regulator [Moorena producens]AOX03878.1 two-component system response regulator [Moorena producens PAL-8-15-08-1]
MQGTLSEIDIRSILQLIELGQRTGELLVEAYSPHPTSKASNSGSNRFTSGRLYQQPKLPSPLPYWFVFFLNGQIAYAADSDGSLSRLHDYLRRYKANDALEQLESLSIAATNALEYGYLWALLENHVITPNQGRSIIQSMVNETLFDLLSLHHGYFVFEIGPALAPQLTTLEIGPLLREIMKQVQEWKQLCPHIQSPHQCPMITAHDQLQATLPEKSFKLISSWVDGKTSLRQLSRYLHRDLITVARAIYPYVQQGSIQMVTPKEADTPAIEEQWELKKVTRSVVCVDDDLAVGKAVEYTLQAKGYKVTAIQKPLKALSQVFQLQPDLILCDLVMPDLDGYELCGMLRQSRAFRQTPIIMLTGKDGFIDRVRARMVGATDYLTKPFGDHELLMLLEKYIWSR